MTLHHQRRRNPFLLTLEIMSHRLVFASMSRNRNAVLPSLTALCECGNTASGSLVVLQEMGWIITGRGYLSCPYCDGDMVKAVEFGTGWTTPPDDGPLIL